ncbi:hypothetical protein NL676_038340 [Syzygium grande]|nr:hypothetical protein NL676_038340 [Syzygium grande]
MAKSGSVGLGCAQTRNSRRFPARPRRRILIVSTPVDHLSLHHSAVAVAVAVARGEKKLSKVIVPDKWKDGASNTTEGGGRKINESKLLSKKSRPEIWTLTAKALELHPDKRPDDPDAHANFQKLKSSYEILKDEKARKLFDDLLRVKREQLLRWSQQDSKRRKMVSDLEERERAAFAPDSAAKAKNEEERIVRKLREEIERIRAMHANKGAPPASSKGQAASEGKDRKSSGGVGLDKEKVLKVSWEMSGPDYTVERLKELFSAFGEVEDIVTRKKRSALVVMASKDAAVAATRTVCGDLSNPLLVVPLQPVVATNFPSVNKPVDKDLRNDLVGAGYQDFEDSVMKKLQKAAARQNQNTLLIIAEGRGLVLESADFLIQ